MISSVKPKNKNPYIELDKNPETQDLGATKPKIQSLANSVISRLANALKNRPAANQYVRMEEQ